MIQPDDISRILRIWPGEEFTIGEDGVIADPELTDFIDINVENLKTLASPACTEYLQNRLSSAYEFGTTQAHIANGYLFLDFCSSIYNYIFTTYKVTSAFHECSMKLIVHMLETYHAFISQTTLRFVTTSLGQLRTLYETYVIAKYIGKHRELSQPFLDHATIIQYRISFELDRNKDLGELKRKYDALISQYGNDFAYSFGWTAGCIKDKKSRLLSTLAADTGLADYRSFYILSSELLHANALSTAGVPLFDDQWVAFVALATELLTNGIIHLLRAVNADEKTRIVLMNILYGLREDLYGEPQGIG
jgi:hypothetical protein